MRSRERYLEQACQAALGFLRAAERGELSAQTSVDIRQLIEEALGTPEVLWSRSDDGLSLERWPSVSEGVVLCENGEMLAVTDAEELQAMLAALTPDLPSPAEACRRDRPRGDS